MKQKLFLSLIMTFALWLPLNAWADTHKPHSPGYPHEEIANLIGKPSGYEGSVIRDGISYALPVDLLGVDDRLTYTFGFGKKIQQGDEASQQSGVNSGILK